MTWVDQHGGDARALRFVEIPYAAAAAAVLESRVDAAVLLDPFLSDAVAKGCRVLANCGDALGSQWLETGYFCTREFATKNPAIVGQFARCVLQSNAYVNDHQAELAPMLDDFSRIPLATIAHMTRTRFRVRLDARETQGQIDPAAKYGIIGAAFDAATLLA